MRYLDLVVDTLAVITAAHVVAFLLLVLEVI